MELLELDDSSIDWKDLSTHKYLTCKNHPTARYLTKNPWSRSLHFITPAKEVSDPERTTLLSMEARQAAGWTGPANLECPCPFRDLRVIKESLGN